MSTTLATLRSYVPDLIARRLAAASGALVSPSVERLSAATLMADIAGFTPLAERLAQRGPVGPEVLSRLLNTYFGQLIELITAYGGDVVKFAGDALIALWDTRALDEDLSTATQRAAACALAIQRQLHQAEVGEGIRLALRVGIGAGEVLAAHLGGVYQRWEFILVGPPIVDMSQAEQTAQPGEVVLAPSAWMLVKDRVRGQAQPDGSVCVDTVSPAPPLQTATALPLLPEVQEALQVNIPAAIRTWVAAGQTGWLAELRRVTVLFINLPDLSHTTPLDSAQSVMEALQRTLYRYEGSINKLNVDDKGVTLVAALGLPPLAHEDDAARGVRAALAAEGELRAHGLRSAIGIATGRAFCGSVGNERRREYTMVGDVVNVAARLMQAADGGILCDRATYESARGQLAFELLPSVSVKGKTEALPAYRPLGEAERAPTAAGIVGRETERALLGKALQALRSGQSGVVIMEGEPGIGKSSLVADLLGQAQGVGVTALVGAGDAVEASTPYHAWRTVFSRVFHLDQAPDDTEVRRRYILDQVASDPEATRLAPLLGAVLALDLPDSELTTQMTAQVRADNRHDLLVHILQGQAEQRPTLLVLEDAHWLDSASWTLARLAAQRVRPLLLVAATRPPRDPVPAEYSRLLSEPNVQHVRLEPLPTEDALALVSRRLGVASLPEPVAALIQAKAEGHPFFSEELAYALRDAGLILVADGVCRVAPGADLQAMSFPDTVQGVITQRIDRLSPSHQLTLKVASVIGRVFAFRILRDVHPIDGDKALLRDYLDSLNRLDITPLDRPEPELAYIFKHVITQEVAYNLMLFAQRRDLHRAVAEWYEGVFADDLGPFFPLLAHHWQRADVAPKAIDYLEKAGEQAARSYANEETLQFLTAALALAGPGDTKAGSLRRARWERLVGTAYLSLGRLSESRQRLEQAVSRLGRPMPSSRGKLLAATARQVLVQLVHRLSPQRRGRGSPSHTVMSEVLRSYERLGEVYGLTNDTAAFVYSGLLLVNLAEATEPSPELARGYANACIIAGATSLHALAELYARRGREVARALGDLPALAWVSELTGMYYTGMGQWAAGRRALEEAAEINIQLGNRRQWEESTAILAVMAYQRGELSRALEYCVEHLASARARGDIHAQIWTLCAQAEIRLRQGQTDALLPLLETAAALFTHTMPMEESRVNALRAVVHGRRDEPALARHYADAAAAVIGRLRPMLVYTLETYSGVAETYLRLWETNGPSTAGEREALRQSARRACQALQGFARAMPIARPRAWLWQGLYDWLAGRPSQAGQAWHKSLTAAQRLVMPYDEGLAHYEIGRHATGSERHHHLAQAQVIFTRLDAAYDVRRVEAALARHS